ncbi:hypothetical protein C0585_06050 [Candidatus Woesearchaeota archaeon]|nr:MAG: hypothetical protein C0585_06050 [Candidatus Woesearchaeota archaeon]
MEIEGLKETEIIDKAKKQAENLKFSLFLHILIGLGVLLAVFFTSAIMNGIDITPRTLIPPIFVGTLSGFLIWQNKKKMVLLSLNLEKIIERRTMDLKAANKIAEDLLAKSSKKK